jgi:hypothetical protein
MIANFILILWLYLLGTSPADAAFLLPFIAPALVGTFAGAVLSTVISVAVSYGISYVASKLLTKKTDPPQQQQAQSDVGGVQLDIKADSDVPQSLIVGRAVVGGSRVYTNTYGYTNQVDNSDMIEIIALADHPCLRLAGAFISGLPAAFASLGTNDGARAEGYTDSIGVMTPADYLAKFGLPAYGSLDQNGAYSTGPLTDYGGNLRVRFFDGSQTTCDDLTVSVLGADPDYPWGSNAIGTGVTYVRVHSTYDGEKVQGPMQWFWVVDGIRLYDPRKDSAVGGSGPHEWGNEQPPRNCRCRFGLRR